MKAKNREAQKKHNSTLKCNNNNDTIMVMILIRTTEIGSTS